MRIVTIVLLIACFGVVKGQQAEPLIFSEKIHDFGEVEEAGGLVDYKFTFTNNAGRPVRILSVQASCGCTTPDWSKESIAQGAEGFVKVNFDPRGKPGYFNKSLTVATDLGGNLINLQIKGHVLAVAKKVEDLFPAENGHLRLKTNSFNVGRVFINQNPSSTEFDIYNVSDKPVHFTESISPAHIKVEAPASLAPKEKGKIKISYNAKAKNQYGFVSDNIQLVTDDELEPKKTFSVYATIEEYFPTLTADELSKAPTLQLQFLTVDLGRGKPGVDLPGELKIQNTGKKELVINAVQANCTCVKLQIDKLKLKPGEEAKIQIAFNPQGRKGTHQKAITLYSNDPRNPVQRATVMAYFED